MKTNRKRQSKLANAARDIIQASAPAQPNTLSIAATFEIEAEAQIEAGQKPKARTFKMTAYNGGAMNLGGFYSPVVIDLGGLEGIDKTRPIFRNHDPNQLVGHATNIKVEGTSIVAEGAISGAGDAAREVLAAHDNGFPWQASVGARVLNMEFVKAGSKTTANGREFEGPINIARRVVLGEISFVPLGADDSTSARIAAQAAKGTSMDFEQWLAAKGFTLADLSEAQKTSLQAMYNAEQNPTNGGGAGGNGNGVKAAAVPANNRLSALLSAEQEKEARAQRRVDITAKALQDHPGQLDTIKAMAEQGEKGDWDSDRYELELLRACRPQGNVRLRSAGADDGLSNEVIEAAVCLTGGIDKPEKHFNERTLEAASKRWRHGIGLGELLILFARRNGHDAMSTRNLGPLLKAAFAEQPRIHASGISTLSLPNILGDTANKFLKAGFEAVETAWREIASTIPVKDFRQVSSYSLSGDFEYVELAPGGQIKHAEVGEDTYTNQAKTYARMFGIGRRDIINDDLNALTQVPRRLGRGAALKLNSVFWTKFLDNSAFFTAGRGNYFEGATADTNDTRLNVEGLTRGTTAFANQTDPDGKPVAIQPRILLVPNALAVPAATLMNSTELRNTTANTVAGTTNVFAGRFRVVTSAYLSNSSFTGYSTTAYYLLADPNDVPVIEVAFLNGVQTPTVEQADADFNQLGIQFRGFHDFGVNLQEYRGGVKMKGAA